MMTLEQIKDEHAKEIGFTDFEDMFTEALHTGVDYCVDAVAIKYANQQTKESLSTIRSLALQLDRKGVKTLIDEIDKMIGEL